LSREQGAESRVQGAECRGKLINNVFKSREGVGREFILTLIAHSGRNHELFEDNPIHYSLFTIDYSLLTIHYLKSSPSSPRF
jgi:hypothetical protein